MENHPSEQASDLLQIYGIHLLNDSFLEQRLTNLSNAHESLTAEKQRLAEEVLRLADAVTLLEAHNMDAA